MISSTTRLGLGKLKAMHSIAYIPGIGLPFLLVLWAWMTFYSLENMARILCLAFVPVLVVFLFERYYMDFRYMDCPSCGDFIEVRYDWTCGECGFRQGEDRLLIEPCRHCGRRVGKISCAACREEMGL